MTIFTELSSSYFFFVFIYLLLLFFVIISFFVKANLDISKEKLIANLVCLLDEASKPSHTADLEAEIESYFIVAAARVDMMAKCMDLDNTIGGYNFDIPLLEDTKTSIAKLKKSPSMKLCYVDVVLVVESTLS